MAERNSLMRFLHDAGLAAWFGGSLMGAVGLNGASAESANPGERTHVSNAGWTRWTPINATAIVMHLVGSVALIVEQQGATRWTAPSRFGRRDEDGLDLGGRRGHGVCPRPRRKSDGGQSRAQRGCDDSFGANGSGDRGSAAATWFHAMADTYTDRRSSGSQRSYGRATTSRPGREGPSPQAFADTLMRMNRHHRSADRDGFGLHRIPGRRQSTR
jgi:hypothetical protein